MRRSARLAYCVLFTLAMLLAWVLRDFAKPLLEKIPCTLLLLKTLKLLKVVLAVLSRAFCVS